MLHAVRKLEPVPQVSHEIGSVIASDGRGWIVQTDSGDCRARRAVSCLVSPEPDDRVLLAVAEDGHAWILAVLERREGAPIRIEAEGDVAFSVRRGRFSVAAQEGLDLVTARDASLVAGGLRVSANQAGVRVGQLSYLGRFVQAEVERIKVLAGSLDSVLDRLWQRVKRSYRWVEEADHVRADQIDYAAKKNAQIRGRNALVTAEQLVKVDAEQIHIG